MPSKIKSVYDRPDPGDGIRVLVTRYHPRVKGFKKGIGYDLWLRELSPSARLWKASSHNERSRWRYVGALARFIEHLFAMSAVFFKVFRYNIQKGRQSPCVVVLFAWHVLATIEGYKR